MMATGMVLVLGTSVVRGTLFEPEVVEHGVVVDHKMVERGLVGHGVIDHRVIEHGMVGH